MSTLSEKVSIAPLSVCPCRFVSKEEQLNISQFFNENQIVCYLYLRRTALDRLIQTISLGNDSMLFEGINDRNVCMAQAIITGTVIYMDMFGHIETYESL